jgi:hypothetical protein
MSTTLFGNSTPFCVLLLHVVPLLVALSTPCCCCRAACHRHPATHSAVAALQHPVTARPNRPAHRVERCPRSLFRVASWPRCRTPSDAKLADAVYEFHVKASYTLATKAATPFRDERKIYKVKIMCCSLKFRHKVVMIFIWDSNMLTIILLVSYVCSKYFKINIYNYSHVFII